MGLLARYRKNGGFEQLVYLIETADLEKRKKLIQVIRNEDPGWAALVQSKILTMDKILTWDPLIIAEIITPIPLAILAVALHGLPPGSLEKFTHTMPHMKARELERIHSEAKPNPSEIWAACMRILLKTRELHKEGLLQLQKIDPTLDLASVKVA